MGLNPKLKKQLLKNRLGSEPEEAPQNRSSALDFCVKSASNISRICTLSSLISNKPLAEYGLQPYGPPCRSTTEQIFSLRLLCEKCLQHQQNLYHVFIDFKKAFGRVWHAALWATMRKYNISANLVRTIEQLYDKATSAVQMNGSIGEWFRTTVE